MADNTTLNAGAGGDTIATDDVGGVKYERVKVNFGVDGVATDVSAAAPLPVDTEVTTADLDTGAGTDARAVVGLVRAESGGATLVGSANPLPVSGTVTTGGLTDAQLRAAAVPVSGTFFQATQPVSLATNTPDVTDRDARLLGRAKLLDSTGAVIDPTTKAQLPGALAAGGGLKVEGVAGGVAQPISGTVTANAGTGPFPVSDNAGSLTVDAPVGTPAFVRLSDGSAAITALPVTDNAGSLTVDGTVTVTPPTLTKGTQGATGFSTQDLSDAGRNVTNYFHAAPIITTVAEVMQTLTGYKSGAAVAATATPAVVTAGKTYRVERITVTYVAATVIGGALLRLRANLSGVGVIGSPLVWATYVGIPAIFTAGSSMSYTFDMPAGGLEFAAGTGIALGVIGGGAVPTTGTITGYVMASIEGYEY